MRATIVFAFLLAAFVAISARDRAVAQVPNLPIPEGTQIVAPGPDVPADIAAYIGKWGGIWNGALPSLLIVERVERNGDARGVYIWGDAPQFNTRAGSSKFRAKISNNMLSWGGRVKFEFTRTSDGKLRGERYVDGGQAGDVVMVKTP